MSRDSLIHRDTSTLLCKSSSTFRGVVQTFLPQTSHSMSCKATGAGSVGCAICLSIAETTTVRFCSELGSSFEHAVKLASASIEAIARSRGVMVNLLLEVEFQQLRTQFAEFSLSLGSNVLVG
jgi:hypothetical protein